MTDVIKLDELNPTMTDPRRCQRVTCKQSATHAVKLLIPQKNVPMGSKSRSFEIVVGLPLCLTHARMVKAKELLSEELKESTRSTLLIANRIEPDFSQAKIVPILLTDPDYLRFESIQQKKN